MSRFEMPLCHRFTLVAITFELSLGLLGALLSWAVGTGPLGGLLVGDAGTIARDAAIGLLAALPFLAGLVLIERFPLGLFRRLSRIVREEVAPLFRGTSVVGLLAISWAAGVGEELLFRGFLQATVSDWCGGPAGPWIGLAVASVAFGVCHSLCAAYAVLAALMGLALGGIFLATGHLLAPITMHAVYDAIALVYLVRWSDQPASPTP